MRKSRAAINVIQKTETVENLAALKALVSRPESALVKTGPAAGSWRWELGSSTTADDALVVNPTSGTAGRYKRIFDADEFHAAWFGVRADGTTDDTASCQATIDAAEAAGRGKVVWPAGQIKVTATLYVEGNNIALVGAGLGVTIFLPAGDYGDVFHGRPTGVATKIFRFSASDFSIYTQSDTTSGANLHLERCSLVALERLESQARFGGIFLESVVILNGSDIVIKSDDAFTSFRSGSYLLKVAKHASGDTPSEIFFTNANWRGTLGNNYLHYGILVTECDGILISNPHVGFCRIGLGVLPASNTATVANLNFANGACIDTCRDYGMLFLEPSTSYTGNFGNHQFGNITVYNITAGPGVAWNCAATIESQFNGLIINGAYTHGFQYQQDGKVRARGVDMVNVNTIGTTSAGFQLPATAANLEVDGFSIRGGSTTPQDGIAIDAGAVNFHFRSGHIEGATNPITDGTTAATNKCFANITTDTTTPTVAAGSGGSLALSHPHTTFYLNTTNNVTSIVTNGAADGREVVLIALGVVTVTDGNNLKLAGSFVMAADGAITLRCAAGNWYEIGRSVN